MTPSTETSEPSGTAPEPAVDLGARFDNAYARLPSQLFVRVDPTPVAAPSLLALNRPLASTLGLDGDRLASDEGVAVLAGSRAALGGEPLAMAYAGHQFGNWVPQLGDGRAILLGELIDTSGVRREIQLKGAGRTPFSRGGDGRAWLGPVLREYVLSEAMHALGVPTTRALAAVATGEQVLRETALPGAVLVRVARSHVRVGTFQYLTARGDREGVQALTDHVLTIHYPTLVDAERPALALLDAVVDRQAALIAHWMSLGFIHGVMNTDNCSVLGDTIDYGPCAFMDTFAANTVFSSIDVQARYAWGNQPRMAHWNCGNLAQCLLPLIDDDQDAALLLAQKAVDRFDQRFKMHWAARLGAKIGLGDTLVVPEADERTPVDTRIVLGQRFLQMLEAGQVDFTLGFRALSSHEAVRSVLAMSGDDLDAWWHDRECAMVDADIDEEASARLMAASNPVRIPRNHQVEQMIVAAVAGDLTPMRDLQAALATPFDQDDAFAVFEAAPERHERVGATFCGT